MNSQIEAVIPWNSTLNLFGFTSPETQVEVSGIRIYGRTISDQNGYFSINELPLSREGSEICLSAIDRENRISFPLCLPIPANETTIGPLSLPPTISLSGNFIIAGEKAYLTGQTIPNQEVRISIFSESKSSNLKKSSIGVIADNQGKFSHIIPTDKSNAYRLFVLGSYQNQLSAKSHTLYYYVNTYTNVLIKTFSPYALLLAFLILAGGVVFLLKRKFQFIKRISSEIRSQPWPAEKLRQLRRLWYICRQTLKKYQK